MILTLLVANRGEIARRVMSTARRMGIATVAVYSDPDCDASFVREADVAVPIGGSTPAESYLRGELIVEAARRSGADAVHPGYGFLSENAAFARQVVEAGLTWVGPSPEAIAAMGSKVEARRIMEAAGVPVLPGAELEGVAPGELPAIAGRVGWPVLVKASAGGGGRGMRLVRDVEELDAAVAAARREASSAFGDPTVFLEHYVDDPRHIEIQIFGDHHGNLVHLFERDCSIQRRHQKILEETPSPALDDRLRRRMCQAAVDAGRAIGYTGAGTVEFVLAPHGDFYFLEVNTRLQVEHPVTEAVTGLDLVEVQLAVAEGRPLPPEVLDARVRGHAVEARIYAEDPLAGFLPASGRLHRFEFEPVDGVRVDRGFDSGDTVSTSYDPMLAKVIATGTTRGDALRRLAATLRSARIQGVTTNRDLLLGVIEHEEFAAGRFDTHFLDRHPPAALVTAVDARQVDHHLLADALAEQSATRAGARTWPAAPSGWRNNRSAPQVRRYRLGDRVGEVAYQLGRDPRFTVDGAVLDVACLSSRSDRVELLADGVRHRFDVDVAEGRAWVASRRHRVDLLIEDRFPVATMELAAGSLTAPMPGVVVRVNVREGDRVRAGQPLIYIEAMKMEHPVTAPGSGVVTEIHVSGGSAVDLGTLLAVIDDGADKGVPGE